LNIVRAFLYSNQMFLSGSEDGFSSFALLTKT